MARVGVFSVVGMMGRWRCSDLSTGPSSGPEKAIRQQSASRHLCLSDPLPGFQYIHTYVHMYVHICIVFMAAFCTPTHGKTK